MLLTLGLSLPLVLFHVVLCFPLPLQVTTATRTSSLADLDYTETERNPISALLLKDGTIYFTNKSAQPSTHVAGEKLRGYGTLSMQNEPLNSYEKYLSVEEQVKERSTRPVLLRIILNNVNSNSKAKTSVQSQQDFLNSDGRYFTGVEGHNHERKIAKKSLIQTGAFKHRFCFFNPVSCFRKR